ncbi:MAG TPA: hypothetical protein VFY70_12355 [Thermomicrobiales bacterium]|nr:hypothetical protein [Thermomicrobiales bacterium]
MQPILVVDDDPGIRDALALPLEDAGYAVLAASDGLAAAECLTGTGRRSR